MINYNIVDELLEIDQIDTQVLEVSELETENKKLTALLGEACDLLKKIYIPKEAFSKELMEWFEYHRLTENNTVKKFVDRLSKNK